MAKQSLGSPSSLAEQGRAVLLLMIDSWWLFIVSQPGCQVPRSLNPGEEL